MNVKLITSTALTLSLAVLQGACSAPAEIESSNSERTLHTNQVVDFEYGPGPEVARSILATSKGRNVIELIGEHGAPYATYDVGDTTIYRWGAGTLSSEDDDMVRFQRHELLAYADKDGLVKSISFKKKIDSLVPSSMIASISPN